MMARKSELPFKVGDLVEARSFQIGYRGAWFRCKIREIIKKKGRDAHLLEYYDFPDEKLKTMRLYQVAPHYLWKGKKHRELMVRPMYPPMYNDKQLPDASEVPVIVNNSWKVGDLVDWWSDGCYWSGTITQLMADNDKAQCELKPPPFGESGVYEVFLKDLRPSLDWSLERGWTIPCQEGKNGPPCARIMTPPLIKIEDVEAVSDEAKSTETGETKKKRSLEESSSTGVVVTKYEGEGGTPEAAIMMLEEYINKIKWLKKVLHHDKNEPPPHWESVNQNPKSP